MIEIKHFLVIFSVPCAMPGLANIIYQTLGTSFYGQQGGLYTPTQPLIMGTGGSQVLASGIHPAAPLLPTVPGVIPRLGVPGAVPVRPGIMQPGVAPLNVAAAAALQLNPLRGPAGVPLLIPTPPVSGSNAFNTSTSSSSSHICPSASDPSSSLRGPRRETGAAEVFKTAAVLRTVRLNKEAILRTKRISDLKATADFSSSDGFGDSSSSSLYSLSKNGQSSDMSNSPYNTSREDKDSYDAPERFHPHSSDLDHDMIWENHVEKTQDGHDSCGRRVPKLSKKPPWQQNVNMTPELSFRYQIPLGDMSEVLQRDLDKLKIIGNVSYGP